MTMLIICIIATVYSGLVIGAIIKFAENNVLTTFSFKYALKLPALHFIYHPYKLIFKTSKDIRITQKLKIIFTSFELLPVFMIAITEAFIIKKVLEEKKTQKSDIKEANARQLSNEILKNKDREMEQDIMDEVYDDAYDRLYTCCT